MAGGRWQFGGECDRLNRTGDRLNRTGDRLQATYGRWQVAYIRCISKLNKYFVLQYKL